MPTPLSTLLIDLLTDPLGREALGEDPAAVLADHGWSDLTPRDLGDALRQVTANGPDAAAHAGAEVPDHPTSWADVLEPVLDATTGVEIWEPDTGPALVAGAIEPDSLDFEPPPLVGVAVADVDGALDDPFLSDGDEPTAVNDTSHDAILRPGDDEAGGDETVDLTYGSDTDAGESDLTAPDATDGDEVGELDDAALADLAAPTSLDDQWQIDEPEVGGGIVEHADDVELPDAGWGDLDDDLD